MAKYDVEMLITVTRVFADPNRPPKTFSDTSTKTVEADNEEDALNEGFKQGVMELTGISGITPDIDRENMRFSIVYPNRSHVEYSDFKVKKSEKQD